MIAEAEAGTGAPPEAETLWRHLGTGRMWRCLGPMGGRLPGGVRRAGAAAVPVDEEGRDCGEPEWRCLRSWAASMRREDGDA